MLKNAVLIFALILALLAALLYSQRRETALKVSGFVETDEIRLGSRVGGRVARVHVQEGDVVEKETPLVELDPYLLLDQKAQAQGVLAEARAELDRLTAGYRAEEIGQAKARRDQLAAVVEKLERGPREEDIAIAKAQYEQAIVEAELAQTKFQRTETLLASKAVTPSDMDQATKELRAARAVREVRKEELTRLQRGTRPEELAEARAQLEEATQAWELRKNGYRREEIRRAKAAVEAAEAALQVIERQIEELVIRAPMKAVVEAIELRPGDLVGANAPAISLLDRERLWVRAYVPENHLDLPLGHKVWVTVDSYPGRKFAGHVSFISRQAEFTPGNVQTPEERSKQVFRIKVLLDEGADVLRPGMAADVWLKPETRPS